MEYPTAVEGAARTHQFAHACPVLCRRLQAAESSGVAALPIELNNGITGAKTFPDSARKIPCIGLAGEPYARYLSRRIWKRLGASDAVVQLDREGGNTRTFCCLKSTAQDWARVGELVRTGGSFDGRRILQSTTIKELLAPSPLNAASGMSWLLEPVALVPRSLRNAPPVALTPFAEAGVAYIGGRGGQRVYVVPGQDAVVVRIGKIRNDFDDGQFLNPFIDALKSTP